MLIKTVKTAAEAKKYIDRSSETEGRSGSNEQLDDA